MLVLMLFAVVAGAGTAITPCVLPVLPVLLSASVTGGRRRPIGIVVGLAATYTIAVVALASVIDGVGLAGGATRTFAIAVLFAFGLGLLLPVLREPLERALAPLSRLGPRSAGNGFWSGLGVGAALGFLYAPCAGPILAAVVSVSASSGSSAKLVAIAVSYSLGSAAVLLLFALGGRRVTDRIRRAGRGLTLQRVVGVVMIVTAALMSADLDVRFQTALANHFPNFLVNPTRAIERSHAVESRLADLRGKSRFDSERASKGEKSSASGAEPSAPPLPVLGKAPEFKDTQRWFNTGGKALSLRELRGRVVLIDFWSYTCINCIRTLPALRAWDDRYRKEGLTIVGVHTPEFSFERDAGNVKDAIAQNKLRYAVVQDNKYGTWNAWGNQYWPAKYLIDESGNVRYTHFGEGAYGKTETAIRALLRERGEQPGKMADARVETPSRGLETPETYLGALRADGWVPRNPKPGTHDFARPKGTLPTSHFAFGGVWKIRNESATAIRSATVDVRFGARRVFLVLGSGDGNPHRVHVLLDGRTISARDAGDDVHRGVLTVRHQRLYRLVALSSAQHRTLTLRFDRGVSGYAFTFG
jgi:cytochrome c biogenesis protein CcdA/thiol-disulfide isomerase/thioredoxin